MKKIIISPLNWGLGHATRCVPVINALIENGFTPIIASDGSALQFLQKEFPSLERIVLPSYNISYAKNVKFNLILKLPKILKAVKKERNIIENYIIKNNDVIGIISDNRFGVRSNKVPSVYITHQLKVLAGWSTFFITKIHQKIINQFDECWIPDDKKFNFSGVLSIGKLKINKKYLGVLSRFQLKKTQKVIDVLVILSGVEPQRTLLEEKLVQEFKNSQKKVVFVAGKIEQQQKISIINRIRYYNFMLSNELENTINQSKLVICRSGYSSVMDLVILQKKVFFIPTKHQNEQEYLARYLSEKKYAPFCKEQNFSVEKLQELTNYLGLFLEKKVFDKELFCLFECK